MPFLLQKINFSHTIERCVITPISTALLDNYRKSPITHRPNSQINQNDPFYIDVTMRILKGRLDFKKKKPETNPLYSRATAIRAAALFNFPFLQSVIADCKSWTFACVCDTRN